MMRRSRIDLGEDQQDHFDDAEDRSGTTRASPTYLRVGTVLATVNDAARRLRRWPTAIIDRGSARRWWNFGRDEETARSQTKKLMRA
jgi:hypothetical protein